MYYVIIIQRGNEESRAIYGYENYDDAVIAYHSNCGSSRTSAKAGTLSFYLIKLENDYGNTELVERYEKPVEPVEPTEE